jgi:hypothetical protein
MLSRERFATLLVASSLLAVLCIGSRVYNDSTVVPRGFACVERNWFLGECKQWRKFDGLSLAVGGQP